MNKKLFFILAVLLLIIFTACENQWMIDLLPDLIEKNNNGGGNGGITLSGSASLNGSYQIGGTITLNTDNISFSEDVENPANLQYQWKTGNANVNSENVLNSGTEYLIQGNDAGKVVTCVITHPETTNSITASFNNGEEVPFLLKINLVNLDENGYDKVSFLSDFDFDFDYSGVKMEETTAVSGSSTLIYYKLKGSHANNEIEFHFGTSDPLNYITEKGTDINGTVPHNYIVNRQHASDGIITIRVYSIHTDAEIIDTPENIELAKDGTITFTAGANNITADCAYTYRLYKNDVNVDGVGEDRNISQTPAQIGSTNRYTVNIPSLETEMLELGAGEYTIRMKAYTTNPDYSDVSLQSANSTSVYVRELTVNITGAAGSDKVSIDNNGEKYYPNTQSEYTSTFTINVFEDTEIILTAIPGTNRGVTWSGDGTSGVIASKRIIFIVSANSSVTAAFEVIKQNQTTPTITNGNITKTWGDSSFTLNPSGGESTGAYNYTISPALGVISITGNTVTITGAGTATVKVMKAGDSNYNDSSLSESITIKVNKAPGKMPGVITASSVTNNSITVNAVTVTGNDQNITYGISTADNGTGITWQAGTTFSGLSADTTYYVYARSEESSNYLQGIWGNGTTTGGIRVSVRITTEEENTTGTAAFTINFEVSKDSSINWFITNNTTPAEVITISRANTSQQINFTGVTGSIYWEIDTRNGEKSGTGTAPALNINPSLLFKQSDVGPAQLFIKVTVGSVDYETTIPVIITN